MTLQTHDLWNLVLHQQCIAPQELAEAVEHQAAQESLDYRSRLLIRDSVEALRARWGTQNFENWLRNSPVRARILAIGQETFERVGFPFLKAQVMEPTDPEDILKLLRELGRTIHRTTQITIGGSGALILAGYLSRRTQDLDVVDEVPSELRLLGDDLERITQRYRLQLAHFQSHYLPKGWEQRVHSEGPFDRLQVMLVDVYDVFLSKLFSQRDKDKDDLRVLAPQLEKDILVRKLRETTSAWISDPQLRQHAEDNWYILYGETLPT